MLRFSCCLLLACPLVAFSTPPKHLAPYVVPDRYRPFAPGQQKLTGLLANRMRANIEGYLEHIDAGTVTQAMADAQSPDSTFQPQIGMLIDAASNAFDVSRDTRLKSDLDRIVGHLLQTQTPGGYLDAYTNAQTWQPREFAIHRSDLLGLLAYYRVTKSPGAFEAAQKIGDALVGAFSSAAGQNKSLAYFLEPMAYLYRYTADERYLEFCRAIARPLASSAAVDAPPTEEGISRLLGFAELYRLTGDGSLLDAASTGWKELHDLHLSIAGTVVADRNTFDLGTQCTTTAWFELTLDLLRLTGNARYGAELEHTIYNALLAAQDPRTGNIAPSLSLVGAKQFTAGVSQCVPCESLAITNLPAATWGRYGHRAIAVVQYSGGRAVIPMSRRETVQIYSEGSFPESGEILLHVDPSHSVHFPLLLRVPDWVTHFTADLPGSHMVGNAGEFVALNRVWHRGDTVKISMDLTVRAIRQHDVVAIQRGPQLLALGKTLNPNLQDLQAAALTADKEQVELIPAENDLPANWPGDQAYSLPARIGGKTGQITLLPFADALSCTVWLRTIVSQAYCGLCARHQ